ncbi:MAG: LPS biosynthesis protein WbpP [Candidatus Andersenbacteria bacterium CG10_big_fil_rev_8_21_14_0_10_54_11]|uniref:LPS biosynthesis protein WbpP n=1 Tax=Candidatus Andersenbacteria bacterium CG10_big_fil_rev_8_21_14_0_10_54_11 TaxID=1974485 RepID=A0A2M6WZ31_9BACT|nr:MAG: LPS biosynthesis protein WbpP [Candidatus Andersenbacteria bacterium CG10_big_fil_rev_8_21_14_0_10_54_11]
MAVYAVTGGAGFIGSHLAERLVKDGHTVRVLDNFSTGSRDNLAAVASAIEVIEGDIVDADAASAACRGVDFVLHHAAVGLVGPTLDDPLAAEMVNVTGTLRILEAARRAGCRGVVCASSAAVYGNPSEELPRREDALPQPESPYAVTKLAVEHYSRVYRQVWGLPVVCLRYFNVYGPRQRADSVYAGAPARFLAAVAEGKPLMIYGDGRQARDFVYVQDIVAANLAAAEQAATVSESLYNVGSGQATTILDLAAAVSTTVRHSVQLVHTAARAGDVRYSHADITRARRQLGFTPHIALADGLSRMVSRMPKDTSVAARS